MAASSNSPASLNLFQSAISPTPSATGTPPSLLRKPNGGGAGGSAKATAFPLPVAANALLGEIVVTGCHGCLCGVNIANFHENQETWNPRNKIHDHAEPAEISECIGQETERIWIIMFIFYFIFVGMGIGIKWVMSECVEGSRSLPFWIVTVARMFQI